MDYRYQSISGENSEAPALVEAGAAVPGTASTIAPTTVGERALLVLLTAILPIQDQFTFLGHYSAPTLVMGACLVLEVINRPQVIRRVWLSPVFLAMYGLLYCASLLESLHPNTRYDDLSRIAQMVLGAVVIAALCRDLRALKSALTGLLIGSLCLSALIFMTSYGKLSSAAASDFHEATVVRHEAFEDSPLQANLNTMAFGAAQGAVLALSFSLTARGGVRKAWYLGLTGFCLVATFLPVSRSGIVIAIVACAGVLLAYRGRNKFGIILLLALVLGGAVIYFVPGVVFSRMSYNAEVVNGKQEARAKIYTAAFRNMPEFALAGVGAGNFWEKWGFTHGWNHGDGTLGPHNCFFAVAIYWGITGLGFLLAVVWYGYRCMPPPANDMRLCLRGLAVSAFLYLFVMHLLYSKQFCLALGLLVGARQWIWPKGLPVAMRRAPTP